MRYNHFSMLPERAFQPRCGRFGGMTLEGGRSGGGGASEQETTPKFTRATNPQPVPPFLTAGGGFMGRGSPGNPVTQAQFDADRYIKQNPDVAANPYYKENPFQHYQDFGFVEQRSPFEGFQYAPSLQQRYNRSYVGSNNPNMVFQAYQNILGRAPDPSGASFYNQQMQQGLTGQGLVGSLTTSPEFQRQQEYNRAYTEAFRPGYKEFGPNKQYYQPIYQSRYTDYTTPMSLFNQGINTAYSPSYSGFLGGFGNPPASSAASNTIGGIGTSGRLAAGGEIDDNPGDDDGIRALLGRQ